MKTFAALGIVIIASLIAYFLDRFLREYQLRKYQRANQERYK
jgi:hypothetical protein